MKALELAAYVVNKCVNDPSLSITNLQLQKIMYFLQIRALKDNPCKPIIEDENFEAWKFGPVLTHVYYTYSFNGGLDIDKYILGDEENVLPRSSDVLPFVDELVDKALKAKPWKLVALTHKEDGAWKKAISKGYNTEISMVDMIEESKNFNEDCFLED